MTHDFFLKKALNLAEKGRGFCAPNPSVGAILVRDGVMISEGYHQGPGTPHAEIVALKKLDKSSDNLVLYVTLEPCNHWGRTPPCVDSIIEYGVQKVVYAFRDPHPLVAQNDTPSLLRARGIEVLHYPLADIDSFYQSYVWWLHSGKPFVTVKMAQSLDGKIAESKGMRTQLSNKASADLTHQFRLQSDMILTTASTILSDNPLLNVRTTHPPTAKQVAILDRHLSLSYHEAVFANAASSYIFYDETLPKPRKRSHCEFIPLKVTNQLFDLEELLHHIGQLGAHDLWVEAGAKLCASLHAAGLVNQSMFYIAPVLLGTEGYQLSIDKTVFHRQHSVSWRILEDNAVLSILWGEHVHGTH